MGRMRDDDLPAFLADLRVPGLFDTHVHFMPDRMQAAVWAHFDELDPPWPIIYRLPEDERLALLRRLGVHRHTALAYAHRPGVARWLNHHTLALAARDPQVVGSFTLYPEPDAGEYVTKAIAEGGACVKVHLQVGKFDPVEPLLSEAWSAIERAGVPVVLHAGAVDDGSGGEEWTGVAPVRRLLERHPGLRLIVAHLGIPHTAEFLDLAAGHPELRLDTAMALTGSARIGGAPPAWLAERLAGLPGQVLFGSDFASIPHSYATEVDAIAGLGLGDEWVRGVLWENAARLFGA
jgi:predicted TIM-barrel fold metal-dependent hydrolase